MKKLLMISFAAIALVGCSNYSDKYESELVIIITSDETYFYGHGYESQAEYVLAKDDNLIVGDAVVLTTDENGEYVDKVYIPENMPKVVDIIMNNH